MAFCFQSLKDSQSKKQLQDKDQVKETSQAHLLVSLKDFRQRLVGLLSYTKCFH